MGNKRRVSLLRVLALSGAVLFALPAYAPPPVPRLALVVGNASHHDNRLAELRTVKNDTQDMAGALEKLGYQVTTQINADLQQLQGGLNRFAEKVTAPNNRNAVVVIYFAGYGLQKGGRNFLLPVDFDAGREDQDFNQTTLPLDTAILKNLARNQGANVVLLDACRDDPFGQRQGLAQVDGIPNGTLVEFAAEPNSPVVDSVDAKTPERNGQFAKQLLKELERGNSEMDLRHFFDSVANNVYEASNQTQKPRMMTAQTPPALPDRVSMAGENSPVHASAGELQAWHLVEKSPQSCAFEQYLRKYPEGQFADAAKAAIQSINSKNSLANKAYSDLPEEVRNQLLKTAKDEQAKAAKECAKTWAFKSRQTKPNKPYVLNKPRFDGFLKASYSAGNPSPSGSYSERPILLAENDEEADSSSATNPEGDTQFQGDYIAAQQGEINAMYRIAMIYQAGGHGVDQNEAESLRWLALASAMGNGQASYQLYRYFAAQDSGYAKAVKYKSLASRQGYYGPVTLTSER